MLLALLLTLMMRVCVASTDPCIPEAGYEIFASVKENLPVLSVIYSLNIPGSQSEVDLLAENNTYLHFDPVSRNITLKTPLDRDTSFPGDHINFFVKCKGKGDSAYIKITFRVLVNDVNDNAPRFTRDKYEVTVKESKPVGSLIETGILATDNDTDNNGLIYYRIVHGPHSHYFDIVDPVKTNLKLIEKLDYETEKNFTIEILAEDQSLSEPSLNDTTLLIVHVDDADDLPPKFSLDKYTGTVAENSLPGTVVNMTYQIIAFDQDITFNDSVVYSFIARYQCYHASQGELQATYAERNFAIDRYTAEVTVNKTPSSGTINIVIQATQENNNQQSGISVLEIKVIETNMNRPVFQQNFYTVTVPENTPVATTILKVTATDKDFGSTILYGIDHQNTFRMDRANGFIVVNQPIDYEGQKQYHLQVTASDGMFTTIATVEILVADVNDNNPIIDNQQVVASLKRELGTVVTQIQAHDLDNNTVLTYALLAHVNIFAIDSAGYITIINDDDITEDVYILAVTVTDNGAPPRQAAATVTANFPPLLPPSPVAMATAGSDLLAIVFGVIAAVLLIIVTILIIYIIRRRLKANEPLDKAKMTHTLDPKGLLYQKNAGSRSASRANINFRGDHQESPDGTTIAKNPFTIGETDFRMDDNSNYGFMPSDESETDRDMDEIHIETAVIPFGPGQDTFYHPHQDGFHPADEDDSYQDKMNHSFANGSLNTFKNSSSNESLHSDGANSKTMLMNNIMDGKKPMAGKKMPWENNGHLASMKAVHSIDPDTGVTPIDEKPEITVYF